MLTKELNLLATEPEGLFAPRKVQLLDNVEVGERDDFVWSKLDKPFDRRELGYDHPATCHVLLATRHFGYTVRNLEQLPLDVYVCRVNKEGNEMKIKLSSDDVSIMAWGLLLSSDDSRTDLEEIYNSIVQIRGNVNYINPVNK